MSDGMRAEYSATVELTRAIRETGQEALRHGVQHWSRPAGKISADFFCTVEHPTFGWFCLLGDASGHGLPSAVSSLHVPMLFRESVLLGMSVPSIYRRIQRFMARQCTSGGYFVCGTLLRVRGREVEVINAGMPDAILLTADGRVAEVFGPCQLPFGIEGNVGKGNVETKRYRLALDEQATLLLRSDGFPEWGGLSGDALGHDGILESARNGTECLFETLVDQAGKAEGDWHDDASIVTVALPLHRIINDSPALPAAAAQKQAVRAQVANLAAALRIVENHAYGLLLTDAEQQIVYANPAFCVASGYAADELVGQTPRLLNSGRHDIDFYRNMWRILSEQGHWSGEVWNRHRNGTLYPEWLDIRTIHDEEGHVINYLATYTALRMRQMQEERLQAIILHDAVTGLANRALLMDRGMQAVVRADRSDRAMALMFIDLDRFKSINDSLGHEVGDMVLTHVAHRFQSVLRGDDTLARFNGDEFVCLLPDIADRHDAAMVANKLLSILAEPVEIAGRRFKISASIGISAYPSNSHDFDGLLVQADRAMLSAKQAGGNMFKFFSAQMAATVDRQLEFEARLDKAICAGELELFYQPKFDMVSHLIVGAEALVRWRDPRDGLVSPGVFIPVAEKSDLIARIGAWVMREACAMLARRAASLPEHFHVAVNVSPMQFERCDVAEEVASILAESGVSPHRLELEVTESMIIRNAQEVADVLKRITDLGVVVSLDDFGTGYSNLGALTRLPLGAFKLDQSFVRDVDTKPAHASIARSVWHLADGLSKKVIAEGIETCAECNKLMDMGYRYGQGYRFGKPMPEDEFIDYLGRWKPSSCLCPIPRADFRPQ